MKNSTYLKIYLFVILANFTVRYFPFTTIIVFGWSPLYLQSYFYWKRGVCYIYGDNVIKGKSAHWYLGSLFMVGLVNTASVMYDYFTI